jgi:Zn-finger nucleic acid-binding protein
MQCPSCVTELVRQDHTHNGFVRLDLCEKCHGCWIDHAELETMEAGVWADLDELGLNVADALSELACPRCRIQMTAVTPEEQPKLRVDRCPECCGIWLDNGELRQLQNVLDEHANEYGEPLQDRPESWSRLHWAAYRILAIGAAGGSTQSGLGLD